MRDNGKKQVSADIPFAFLNALGHDTRAMEGFFSLPREARETLAGAVAVSEDADTRGEQARKSLANGGDGFCKRF